MDALERIEMNNKCVITCMGDDVEKRSDCKRISIKGKEFDVITSELTRSFSGKPVLWLMLKTNKADDIPLGHVNVLK